MAKQSKSSIVLLLTMAFFLLSIYLIWQNEKIVVSNYLYSNPKIPESFNDYRIVQLSDLHSKDFNGRLSKMVEGIKPDIIVITGDLIDRRNSSIDKAIGLVKDMVAIAPTYFVSGNHEELSDKYSLLKTSLRMSNVTILENSLIVVNRQKDAISLMGISDPASNQRESTYLWDSNEVYMSENLDKLLEPSNTNFTITLSHRPELFSVYKDKKVDLVFSGHAHGGQIRLPFIGGVIAPNQGFFPKYTEGIHYEDSTTMVVSRGLGNSIIPLRVFNPPEIVVVTLKSL